MQKMSSTSPKIIEAETSADSPLLDVGTEDEVESREDEDLESSTRVVQEATESKSKSTKMCDL